MKYKEMCLAFGTIFLKGTKKYVREKKRLKILMMLSGKTDLRLYEKWKNVW